MLSCACDAVAKAMPPSTAANAAPKARYFVGIGFLLGPKVLTAAGHDPLCRFPLPVVPAPRPGQMRWRGIHGNFAPSIWERPHPQLLFGDLPQARQPVRLDHQEEDDERPLDHERQVVDG